MGIDTEAVLLFGIEINYEDVMRLFKKYVWDAENDYEFDEKTMYDVHYDDVVGLVTEAVNNEFDDYKHLKYKKQPRFAAYSPWFDCKQSYMEYYIEMEEEYYDYDIMQKFLDYLEIKEDNYFNYTATLNIT